MTDASTVAKSETVSQRDYLEELRESQRDINRVLTDAGREVNYLRSMIRTLSDHLPKDHPYWPGIQDILSAKQPGLFAMGYALIDEMVGRDTTSLQCDIHGYWLRITACPSAPHPDDQAVDRFASAMKAKLAKKRGEGRGGWEDDTQCHVSELAKMLVGHVAKGDPVDIGNFAMMLFNREGGADALRAAATLASNTQEETHGS